MRLTCHALVLSFVVTGCAANDDHITGEAVLQNPSDGKTDWAWNKTIAATGLEAVAFEDMSAKGSAREYKGISTVTKSSFSRLDVTVPHIQVSAQNNSKWRVDVLSPEGTNSFAKPLRMLIFYRTPGERRWKNLGLYYHATWESWQGWGGFEGWEAGDADIPLPFATYFHSIDIDMEKNEVLLNNELFSFFPLSIKEEAFKGKVVEFSFAVFPLYNFAWSLEGDHDFVVRAECTHGCDSNSSEPLPDLEPAPIISGKTYYQAEFCNNGVGVSAEKFAVRIENEVSGEVVVTQPRFDVPEPGQCVKTGAISCERLGALCGSRPKLKIQADYTFQVTERHEDNNEKMAIFQ